MARLIQGRGEESSETVVSVRPEWRSSRMTPVLCTAEENEVTELKYFFQDVGFYAYTRIGSVDEMQVSFGDFQDAVLHPERVAVRGVKITLASQVAGFRIGELRGGEDQTLVPPEKFAGRIHDNPRDGR